MTSYTLLSSADLQQPGYKPLVRIQIRYTNGQGSWGSGVLVGANDVLTSAHLFAPPSGASISDVLVYPGYYYGASSVPALSATRWVSLAKSSTVGSISLDELPGDLAVVSLSQAMGFDRGYWGVGASFTSGPAWTAGYPSTLNGAPAVSTGWVSTLLAFNSNALSVDNLYAQPGSSGSPVYVMTPSQQPSVVGVLSTGSWAVNLTDTSAGKSGLDWVQDQIILNNLDAASALPRIAVTSAVAAFGHGVTQLVLHFPVTLSTPLAVDTHLRARLLDPNGQSYGSKALVIPAGGTQALLELPVPTQTQTLSTQWTLNFSGADNALFVSPGGAPALEQQVQLRIDVPPGGAPGGSDLAESVVLSDRNDVYQGLGGNDEITGGAGVDLAIYRGPLQDYLVQRIDATGALVVQPLANAGALAKSDATDTLRQVERLKFADASIAFDLNANAGSVARVMGAVLGRESLQNKALVGYALGVLDGGVDVQSLISQALRYALGASFSIEAEVRLLYKNLMQVEPDGKEIMYWSDKVTGGELTLQTLALTAAASTVNAVNINLVGLTDTGLGYIQ